MASAVAEEFSVPPPQLNIPFGGRSDRAIVGDVFGLAGVAFTEANWRRFVTRYVLHLEQELSACEGGLCESVTPVLETVSTAGHLHVGLLTGNLEAAAWRKVQRFGIGHHFSFGGFGDRQPDRDDIAREAAATVAERFGDEPQEIIVVGDTPADVKCGRAIGATTVAVATGSASFQELAAVAPDHVFHTLTDARNYFGELAAG